MADAEEDRQFALANSSSRIERPSTYYGVLGEFGARVSIAVSHSSFAVPVGVVIDLSSREEMAVSDERSTADRIRSDVVIAHTDGDIAGVADILTLGERSPSGFLPGKTMDIGITPSCLASARIDAAIPVLVSPSPPNPTFPRLINPAPETGGHGDAERGAKTGFAAELRTLSPHARRRDRERFSADFADQMNGHESGPPLVNYTTPNTRGDRQ